jgi:two-component system response regulator FixJ
LERNTTLRQRETELAELRTRLDALTAREREVMDLIVEGHPNKVVAARFAISPRTVEIHRARIMEKMRARNLSDLVRMSLRLAKPDA